MGQAGENGSGNAKVQKKIRKVQDYKTVLSQSLSPRGLDCAQWLQPETLTKTEAKSHFTSPSKCCAGSTVRRNHEHGATP